MSVQLITGLKNYICLAGDTKPTSADVITGSICHETDTGKHYVYNGTAWLEDITFTTIAGLFSAALLAAENTWTAAQAFSGPVSMLNTDVTVKAHGTVSSGTETLDRADGEVHTLTAGGDFTIAFGNWPASGKEGSVTLKLTNGGAHTITWPGAVVWPGGSEPSWTAAGRDTVIFTSGDGGTTIDGYQAGADMS